MEQKEAVVAVEEEVAAVKEDVTAVNAVKQEAAAVKPARPRPPWHPIPLVELSIAFAVVLGVIGVISMPSQRGQLLLIFALGCALVGGMCNAAFEHFSGYRRHTAVLAALPAVGAMFAADYCGVARQLCYVVAAVVFVAVFWSVRRVTKDGGGGASSNS